MCILNMPLNVVLLQILRKLNYSSSLQKWYIDIRHSIGFYYYNQVYCSSVYKVRNINDLLDCIIVRNSQKYSIWTEIFKLSILKIKSTMGLIRIQSVLALWLAVSMIGQGQVEGHAVLYTRKRSLFHLPEYSSMFDWFTKRDEHANWGM